MAADTGRVLLKTVEKKCPVRIPTEDQLTVSLGHKPIKNKSMLMSMVLALVSVVRSGLRDLDHNIKK